MSVKQAVVSPRVHHQWLPDFTSIEANSLSTDTLESFQARGHQIRERGSQGAAMGVYYDREQNLFLGASDSRRGDGGAVGY